MSGLATRQTILDALNTVDDIRAFPRPPATRPTGTGWVRWVALAREDTFIVHTWQALILIPASDPAQQLWVDDHLDEILAVLAPIAFVDQAELGTVGGDDETPVLEITMRSE